MAFTNRTFELLLQLEESGKYSFYKENEADFKKHLVLPFRELVLEGVIPNLPNDITNSLNTRKRMFGRIDKGPFGKGGANPFYWAAFCPNRSENRQQDVQLLTFINHEFIEFGFFFGWDWLVDRRLEYLNNVDRFCDSKSDYERTIEFLCERFPEGTPLLRHFGYKADGETVIGNRFTWRDYFEEVRNQSTETIFEYGIMDVLSRDAILGMSTKELATEISTVFGGLFPLVILASHSDPLPILRAYLADWE